MVHSEHKVHTKVYTRAEGAGWWTLPLHSKHDPQPPVMQIHSIRDLPRLSIIHNQHLDLPSMQHMPSIVEFQIPLKGTWLITDIGSPLIRANNTTLKLLQLAKTALFSWKKYLTLLLMLQDFVSFLLVTTALVTSPEAQAVGTL